MRSRLFLKVYLTLLASLVAVSVATGLFWRITTDREESGWMARRDRFLIAMLPASDTKTGAQAIVDRLAKAFDADISLYDPTGVLIASAGKVLPSLSCTPSRSCCSCSGVASPSTCTQ